MALTSAMVRNGNHNSSLSVASVIRGYHMYQRIWMPTVGEKATTVRELGNEHDRCAIAVLEDETLCIVGHLLRVIQGLS